MPKNLGHIESLARSYTRTAIKTLAGIMMEQTSPPMARIVAAKVLLDRGWGKPKEMHHSEVDDNKPLLKGPRRGSCSICHSPLRGPQARVWPDTSAAARSSVTVQRMGS